MSRVEWSRRTADEVESVIAIMLCRENPAATRVRPSQGDGGIDVYVPHEGKWTVYQVKSFTGSLDSSRKRQIRKSWMRLLSHAEAESIEIAEWFLVRPEDPTTQDEEWLDGLVGGATFPTAWRGLNFCDGLAAAYPDVIDYYFFDGKGRLQDTLRDLMAAMTGAQADDPTLPGSHTERLTALHRALNEHDPHYRYDFAVRAASERRPLPSAAPGLLASVSRTEGDVEVEFQIFARYDEAATDRPVPGRFVVQAAPGTPEWNALRDFVDYGLPAERLPVRDLSMDLPGGLGGDHEGGVVSLGAARVDTARPLKLQLVVAAADSEDVVAAADLDMEPATAGLAGPRFALTGRESAGVFKVVLRFRPDEGHFTVSITSEDLQGREPADVLPGLRTLQALRPPNRLALRLRHGPLLQEPIPVPDVLGEDSDRLIRACEALATIQEHTLTAVRIPDLTQTTLAEVREWIEASRLLEGETLRITWSRVGVQLHENDSSTDATEGAVTVAIRQPLTVEIGGVRIPLGDQVVQLAAATVDPADLVGGPEPGRYVHFIPAGDDTGTVRLVRPSDDAT